MTKISSAMSEMQDKELQKLVNNWLACANGTKPEKYKNLYLFHPKNLLLAQREKDKYKDGLTVVILPESPQYHWRAYGYINKHHKSFDHIFTCSKKLLAIDPDRFHYVPITDCWVCNQNGRNFPQEALTLKGHLRKGALQKSKNISAIFSNKKFLDGHTLRHLLHQKYRGGKKIDFYGTITGKRIESKFPALSKYRFSLAIENCVHDYYFTEKVLDCIATKSLPIFWGATEFIEKHFNPEGFLTFSGIEDFDEVLRLATPAYYKDKLSAVEENYNLLKDFPLQRTHLVTELRQLALKTGKTKPPP